MADDHRHAQQLADAIRTIDGLELRPPQVDTNLVIFRIAPRLGTAAEFSARLKQRGLLMNAFGGQLIRAVTHLDVNESDTAAAVQILRDVAAEAVGGKPAAAVRAAYG